jgi:hypothetical protein
MALVGLIMVVSGSAVGGYVMFAGIIGFLVVGLIIFVTVPRT